MSREGFRESSWLLPGSSGVATESSSAGWETEEASSYGERRRRRRDGKDDGVSRLPFLLQLTCGPGSGCRTGGGAGFAYAREAYASAGNGGRAYGAREKQGAASADACWAGGKATGRGGDWAEGVRAEAVVSYWHRSMHA